MGKKKGNKKNGRSQGTVQVVNKGGKGRTSRLLLGKNCKNRSCGKKSGRPKRQLLLVPSLNSRRRRCPIRWRVTVVYPPGWHKSVPDCWPGLRGKKKSTHLVRGSLAQRPAVRLSPKNERCKKRFSIFEQHNILTSETSSFNDLSRPDRHPHGPAAPHPVAV